MAQSQPQSQPLDPLNLALRDTDTAAARPAVAGRGSDRGRGRAGPASTRRRSLGGELTARKQRSLWGDAWRG